MIQGEKAVIKSQTIKAGTTPKCLTFAYHMYGIKMGVLKLEKVAVNGSKSILFQHSYSMNAWNEYSANLTTESFDYEVGFLS